MSKDWEILNFYIIKRIRNLHCFNKNIKINLALKFWIARQYCFGLGVKLTLFNWSQ